MDIKTATQLFISILIGSICFVAVLTWDKNRGLDKDAVIAGIRVTVAILIIVTTIAYVSKVALGE